MRRVEIRRERKAKVFEETGCHVNEDRAQPPTTSCSLSSCSDWLSRPEHARAADLQAALQAVQEELIACQRLAMLGSLAAMAAHEFNNLLTPIVARAEAALGGDDVPFMRKALDRTLTQSQRAINVCRHLLALAHNEHLPVEKCSVTNAVQEALETATRPLDKDGIELRTSVPDGLYVRASRDLLCQVLLNLVLNARQAMKERGGSLTITAQAVDDCVQIDVCDSGRGIPAEHLRDVMNPFLAANPHERPNDWQQVGLGLSVCRIIAHQHGATLQAFPNEGRGCTFRVRWPLYQDEAVGS